MAGGWAPDGAVQDQIDDTVFDAVQRARHMLGNDSGSDECDDCGVEIPARRRAVLPGSRTCVACQSRRDAQLRSGGINRRGSKDSQLR